MEKGRVKRKEVEKISKSINNEAAHKRVVATAQLIGATYFESF